MGLFAQGTIQMTQRENEVKLRVNPICDYRVRHRMKDQPAKEYTVFVGDDPGKSRIFSVETDFSVHDSLKNLLAEAACNQVKVEIEIDIGKAGEPRVVGLRVPVPPAST